jgi:PKD repeat protein
MSKTANTAVRWAPIVQYTFDFGDGSAKVTQSTNTKSHLYTKSGTYTLTSTKTDSAGNVGTATQTVWVAPPTAALTVIPPQSTKSDQWTVTADASASTGGSAGGETFKFTFGDGTTIDNAPSIVTHTYTRPGKYTVTVLITDSSGLTASASRNVVLVDGYTPLGPVRVLDTRAAIGVPTTTAVPPGGWFDLNLADVPGIPATGVTAVALNVTVAEPSSFGFLTVYPDGQGRPFASNLNWSAGQTVPNLVIVPVVNGKVDFYNGSTGTVHVIADLAGYFTH